MNKEKFGEFVSELRKEKGMTQQELGDKLHLTNKAISKWERGLSFPDVCTLQDIAQALDVSVLELLNGERNTEAAILNDDANRIIENTVNHSSQIIKKIRKKFKIAVGLIIGLFPLLLAVFSQASFYVIKDEKSLDEALLTLAFMFFASILLFITFGIPVLGLVITKIWYDSNLIKKNKKIKKIISYSSYFVFGTWLIIIVIRVIHNSIRY